MLTHVLCYTLHSLIHIYVYAIGKHTDGEGEETEKSMADFTLYLTADENARNSIE